MSEQEIRRVHVFSPDKKEDWRVSVEPIIVEETNKFIMNVPVILLDSRETVLGMDYYWYEL